MDNKKYNELKEKINEIVKIAKETKSDDFFTKSKAEGLIRELKTSFDSLYNNSIREEKTGLYSHNYFMAELGKEIEKAIQSRQKLSLLMLDLDNFKQVNDKFGHAKGDLILKQVAKVIQSNTRLSDVAARFGGEEFSIMLPNTDERGAYRTAEKLRIAILTDSLLNSHNVSVSIGLTSFDSMVVSSKFNDLVKSAPHEIFKQADAALLSAKQHGKNQTRIWKRSLI